MPWWVTLPPWRVGQYPAVLGELAASEHGERIAFVQGVPPAEPSPLADLSASFARVGGNVNFVLTYGDSEGYGPLREAVAQRMRRRGCEVDARDVMMLTGSTQGITLEPGDLLVTGTPSGVAHARKPPAWMRHGDVCEIEIEGIGILRNPIEDEKA